MDESSVYGEGFRGCFTVAISITHTINGVNSQIIKHAKEAKYGT